jgi:hypothetical protein
MATETTKLVTYVPKQYPNIPGGEADFLVSELQRISNSLKKAVEVMKLMEQRMNDNGLT